MSQSESDHLDKLEAGLADLKNGSAEIKKKPGEIEGSLTKISKLLLMIQVQSGGIKASPAEISKAISNPPIEIPSTADAPQNKGVMTATTPAAVSMGNSMQQDTLVAPLLETDWPVKYANFEAKGDGDTQDKEMTTTTIAATSSFDEKEQIGCIACIVPSLEYGLYQAKYPKYGWLDPLASEMRQLKTLLLIYKIAPLPRIVAIMNKHRWRRRAWFAQDVQIPVHLLQTKGAWRRLVFSAMRVKLTYKYRR